MAKHKTNSKALHKEIASIFPGVSIIKKLCSQQPHDRPQQTTIVPGESGIAPSTNVSNRDLPHMRTFRSRREEKRLRSTRNYLLTNTTPEGREPPTTSSSSLSCKGMQREGGLKIMNWKVIFALLVAVGCSVALVSYGGSAKARAALEKKLEELEATLEKIRTERDGQQTEATRLSDSLRMAESQLVSITQQRQDLQRQVKELTDAEDQLKRRVNGPTQSMEELQQRIEAINKERDQFQEQVQAIRQSNTELAQKVAGLTQLRDELQQTVRTLTQSRDQLNDRLNEVSDARDDLQKQLGAFTQGQPELELSVKELTRRWGIVLADMGNIQVRIRLLAVPEFVGSTREPNVWGERKDGPGEQ